MASLFLFRAFAVATTNFLATCGEDFQRVDSLDPFLRSLIVRFLSMRELPSQGDEGQSETLEVGVPLNKQLDNMVVFSLPKCRIPPADVLGPVTVFVQSAVQEQHEKGDGSFAPTDKYRLLVDALRTKKDISMLHMILLSLRTCGNGEILNMLASSRSRHARLVHLLLRLNPFRLPPQESTTGDGDFGALDVADAQLHLMMSLVSANSIFLVPILSSLWNMLTLPSEGPAETALPLDHEVYVFSTIFGQRIFSHAFCSTIRLHSALATASRLCPKAKTEIFPIIAASAPSRFRPPQAIVWFYKQTLLVIKYIPTLEPQILELLVDRSLEIDVEIKISDNGEAAIDDSGENNEEIFPMDMDCSMDPPKASENTTSVTVDEMAEKLDSVMYLLFDYMRKLSEGSSSVLPLKYEILERVFESSILATHKSKFVQFLMLFLCGLEPPVVEKSRAEDDDDSTVEEQVPLYRLFTARLMGRLRDGRQSISFRQTAACYLASFLSRAKYVNNETCCEALCSLLGWTDAYMRNVQSSVAADAREQCAEHSLFYTVSQAAFYIMCFRGAGVIDFFLANSDPSEDSECESEDINISRERWEKLCSHQLQPLRYCLESVRYEFLDVVDGFMDADILKKLRQEVDQPEKRKRRKATKITTAATLEKERLLGGVGGLGKGTNPLDSFFPFDPFLLSRSHVFVEPMYCHWQGSAESADEQNEMDSDDDSSIEDVDDSEGDEDEDDEETTGSRSFDPMSMGSQYASPSAKDRLEKMREVWTDTLKRSRAHSIASENGSW